MSNESHEMLLDFINFFFHNKFEFRRTNEDGRAQGFLTWESFYPGTYKLHFNTGSYLSTFL